MHLEAWQNLCFEGHFMRKSLVFAVMGCVAACGGSSSPNILVVQDSGADDTALADTTTTDAPPSDTGPDPDGGRPTCGGSMDAGGGAVPSARGDATGALDPSGSKLVVFGGDTGTTPCGGTPARTIVGETWMLDVGCGTWTQVSAGGPSARARAAMVTDSARHRALLFGGRSLSGATYTNYAELWAFDFNAQTWTQLTTHGTPPSARSSTAIAISATRDKAYVFGGDTSSTEGTFTPTNDVFSLDLGTLEWSPVAAAAGVLPPRRLGHSMAIDEGHDAVYVYSGGGENALTGPYFDDLWKLDLRSETWSQVSITGTEPRVRIYASMTFDTVAKALVVFGGHDDGDLGSENDTWSIDPTSTPASWKKLAHADTLNDKGTACSEPADFVTVDANAPERRSLFVAAARHDGHGFVVYGGRSDCGTLDDAWWYAGGLDAWTNVFKSPAGLTCPRYSTTCSGLCG